MQGKRSNAENFGLQECKQKQKSSHTGKIRKQKTRLKTTGLAGGYGRGDPIDRQEKATYQFPKNFPRIVSFVSFRRNVRSPD